MSPRVPSPSTLAVWTVPAAAGVWAATLQRHTYFFFDEWSMVALVLGSSAWKGMASSFNGHLWVLQYWAYRVQVHAFGVDDHVFVSAVFVVSLVVLHVALATLLTASGLSRISSTLLGGLLTYLGSASQNIVFAVQAAPAFSLAAGLFATAAVLNGPAAPRRVRGVAALLVVSVLADSGTALTSWTLAAVAAVWLWGRPSWRALAPAAVLLAVWPIVGRGPVFAASTEARWAFAATLVTKSIGALGGGGEPGMGLLAIVATLVAVAAFVAGARESRAPVMLAAGSAAAVLVVAAVTYTRAGIGTDFVANNRYLQMVAIPVALAAAPAIAAAARRWLGGGWMATVFAAVLIVTAFVRGLTPMREYRADFDRHNAMVRAGVADAARVIRDGCPSGRPPDERTQPIGYASPQVWTGLLRRLIERGLLTVPRDGAPDPAVVARICR